MSTQHNNCPHCGVSLIGEPIPEKDRHYYGGATNFKREIGIYDWDLDRTIAWKCPDCEKQWEREL